MLQIQYTILHSIHVPASRRLREEFQHLLNGRPLGWLSGPAVAQQLPHLVIQTSRQDLGVRRPRGMLSFGRSNHDLRGVLNVVVRLLVREDLKESSMKKMPNLRISNKPRVWSSRMRRRPS
jgi:hypothetical protein